MDNSQLEKLLTNFSNIIDKNVEKKHTEIIRNCIPLSRLIKLKNVNVCLDDKEIFHLEKCSRCKKIMEGISENLVTTIERYHLLSAAGTSGELSNILEDCFSNTDLTDLAVICEEQELGYTVRIESEIPIALIMVFFKEDEELYRTEINEQVPDEVIPLSSIKDWTCIKILRE